MDDATQRITAVHCQPTAAGAAEEVDFTLEADAVVFAVGMKALKFFGSTGPLAEYETFRQFGNLRGTDVLAVRLFLNTKLPPPTGGVPSSSSEKKNTYSANACWGFDGGGVGMTVFDLTALHAPSYDEEPGSVVEVDWYYASRLLSLGDDEIVKRAKERADAVLGGACAGATVVDAAVVRLPGAVNWYYPGSYQDMPSVAPGKEEKAKVAGCPANAFFAGDVVKSRHGSWSQEKAFVTGVEAAAAVLDECSADAGAAARARDSIVPLEPDEPLVGAGRTAARAFRDALGGEKAPGLGGFFW